MRNKYFSFIVVLVLSLAGDLGTKWWARHALLPIYPKSITVISGFFDFHFAENPGMAFSLFAGSPWFQWILFPIAILCTMMIFVWLSKLPRPSVVSSAKLGMLLGGAAGNMIDRLVHGKVTDFIVWKITTSTHVYQWPTFNVADALLVVGVALLLLNLPKDKEEAKLAAMQKISHKKA